MEGTNRADGATLSGRSSAAVAMKTQHITRLMLSWSAGRMTSEEKALKLSAYLSAVEGFTPLVVERAVDELTRHGGEFLPATPVLVEECGRQQRRMAEARALPAAAEHRPVDEPFENPRMTAGQLAEFRSAMADLRNPEVPTLGRAALLKIGEKIEHRYDEAAPGGVK